ncbi:hypothetical protein AMATHDRAFT_10633 [Amanita thiersii Skay4041]|uniref:Uncharacterized protein n=1 Tax=Amanita thiersii Skay4041 TaxID=703135 RepID=A0A2A9N9I6_9AGAR|nr:hypothetical protein AMATHDRAFT_10633 [Amanita thiersii Skay4041]
MKIFGSKDIKIMHEVTPTKWRLSTEISSIIQILGNHSSRTPRIDSSHGSEEALNYFKNTDAEQLPPVVQRYLTLYYWGDDIQRIQIACDNLDAFARINFLSIIKNRYFIWILGGEPLLAHYGWDLSTEDRNCFMHALNGNIEAIHKRILLVREFNDAILYIMDSLKDASQNTIDSFFEIREN